MYCKHAGGHLLYINKKHIDASVKVANATCSVSVFYALNIFNIIYYFKPTYFNCAWRMPFVNSTLFFGFVYHVS